MPVDRKAIEDEYMKNPTIDISVPLSITGKQLVDIGTTIPELQLMINEWAVRKEWRGPKADPRHFSDEVALIASEAFEALEAWRDSNSITDVWEGYTVELDGVKFKDMDINQLRVLIGCEEDELEDCIAELKLKPKMMGVAPELADLGIRLMETCQEYGIDLLAWILLVMKQNEEREVRHGGKPM